MSLVNIFLSTALSRIFMSRDVTAQFSVVVNLLCLLCGVARFQCLENDWSGGPLSRLSPTCCCSAYLPNKQRKIRIGFFWNNNLQVKFWTNLGR